MIALFVPSLCLLSVLPLLVAYAALKRARAGIIRSCAAMITATLIASFPSYLLLTMIGGIR